ncbi:hypothetical protein [Nocardioides sp. SR21]|uniref:hypothetical protein n=1 Tax=Nocardioides sp. SR21 TaxID=2919501 RepID=UPI001FAA98E9|nr:hypothetical protein [Nocardioides sp. SR21]
MMKIWHRVSFWQKFLGILVGVVLVASLGSMLSSSSDFPEWLESTATAAALMAALYAARYASRAFDLERDRDERWMQQQRSEQASKIAAWPGGLTVGIKASGIKESADVWEEPDPTKVLGFDLYVRNASDVPVTRVWVDATLVVDIRADRPVRIDFPTQLIARVLEPSAEATRQYIAAESPVDLTPYLPGGVAIDTWCEVSVTFRDAGGRDWQRLPDGQLILVQDANAHDTSDTRGA